MISPLSSDGLMNREYHLFTGTLMHLVKTRTGQGWPKANMIVYCSDLINSSCFFEASPSN